MKKYTLILSISTLLITTNNAYSLTQQECRLQIKAACDSIPDYLLSLACNGAGKRICAKFKWGAPPPPK